MLRCHRCVVAIYGRRFTVGPTRQACQHSSDTMNYQQRLASCKLTSQSKTAATCADHLTLLIPSVSPALTAMGHHLVYIHIELGPASCTLRPVIWVPAQDILNRHPNNKPWVAANLLQVPTPFRIKTSQTSPISQMTTNGRLSWSTRTTQIPTRSRYVPISYRTEL